MKTLLYATALGMYAISALWFWLPDPKRDVAERQRISIIYALWAILFALMAIGHN